MILGNNIFIDFFSLPKTSYLKMMDIWLIVMLSIPFAEVILHTAMDYLRFKLKNIQAVNNDKALSPKEKRYQRGIKLLETFTSIGLPIIFVAFSIFYFIYGGILIMKSSEADAFKGIA